MVYCISLCKAKKFLAHFTQGEPKILIARDSLSPWNSFRTNLGVLNAIRFRRSAAL